jgi:hypothetical protein
MKIFVTIFGLYCCHLALISAICPESDSLEESVPELTFESGFTADDIEFDNDEKLSARVSQEESSKAKPKNKTSFLNTFKLLRLVTKVSF